MERFIGYFKLPFYHRTVEGRPLVFLLNGHNDNRTVDGIAALQAATQKELGVRKLNAHIEHCCLDRVLLRRVPRSALIPSVDITEPHMYVAC